MAAGVAPAGAALVTVSTIADPLFRVAKSKRMARAGKGRDLARRHHGRALPARSAPDRMAAAGRAAGPLHQPQQRFCARQGDPRRHPNHLPVVRRQPARAGGTAAWVCAYRTMASQQGRNLRPRVADTDPRARRRRRRLAVLAGAVPRDLHRDLRADPVIAPRRAKPRDASDHL
jgi:hypothetical protein